MGMRVSGRSGGVAGDINVTPMIDVLLVLLVIFMVVQQGMQRGISVQVPAPQTTDPAPAPPDELVLEVRGGGRYLLNQQPVEAAALAPRLQAVFAGRARSVLFVKGAEEATYGEVVRALEASRVAGIEVVGLVPRDAGG